MAPCGGDNDRVIWVKSSGGDRSRGQWEINVSCRSRDTRCKRCVVGMRAEVGHEIENRVYFEI